MNLYEAGFVIAQIPEWGVQRREKSEGLQWP